MTQRKILLAPAAKIKRIREEQRKKADGWRANGYDYTLYKYMSL